MEIPRPTDDDRAYFASLLPADPRVVSKPMFGNVGAFVNENMFMGLFGSSVGVRLSESDRAALLVEDGAGPFGPAERPMGGYTALPASWRGDPPRAQPWVASALAYVGSLPPKPAKKPKAPRSGANA
jgi:TfoX/Sxy family transcriptional regulator of competence genes